MSDSIHLPFLARNLTVVASSDPSLVGISGQVLEETRRTIIVQSETGEKALAKTVIQFTLDSEKDVIDGAAVTQRPENRVNRKYRRN